MIVHKRQKDRQKTAVIRGWKRKREEQRGFKYLYERQKGRQKTKDRERWIQRR